MAGIDFPPKSGKASEEQEPVDELTFAQEQARAREAMRNAPVSEEGETLAQERARAMEAVRTSAPAQEGDTLAEQYRKAREGMSVAPAEQVEDVVESTEDATPKERMDGMRAAVLENAMQRLKSTEQEAKKQEDTYFEALKKHEQQRGMLSVASEALVGERIPQELRAARRAWVRSRANFANAQKEATNARLAERPRTREDVLEGLEKYKGKGSIDAEKVRARYERMVTLKSVVLGAEERELKVRTEGLAIRDKKAFEKAVDWYQTRVPKGARIVITSALMVGGAAALTGLSPVALMTAGAGAGLRVAAATIKNPAWQKAFGTLALLPSVGGLVGLAAEKATQGVHTLLGTEQKAEELLKKREGLGALDSEQNLERLSRKRREALTKKETIARQSRWARMGSSFLAGGLLGHLFGSHHTGSAGASEGHDTSAAGHAEHPASVTNPAPAEAAQTPAAPAEVPGVPVTPDGIVVGATIHTPGEGFGEMVMEFKKNLHDQAGNLTPSPALKHVLDSDPNALSREIGALTGNESFVMHQGDQLFVDESQNVWFEAQGGEPRLLFHNDASAPGGFVAHHPLEVGEQVPSVHTAEDSSTALNGAQVHAPVVAEAVQPVTIEHLDPVKLADVGDLHTMPQPGHLDTTVHSTPAPEAHPAPHTPEGPQQPHSFADPSAGPLMNPHGVDLNKSQMLVSDGRVFAHGTDSANSYELAAQYSKKLAESGAADTRVYFVAQDYNALGQPYEAVRIVFTPKDSLPQIAPYDPNLTPAPEFTAPPVPKDADYKPLGK